MILSLEGKTAVISGSTAGIGLAIAIAMREAGATVVVCGRHAERVEAAVKELQQMRQAGAVRGVVADLSTAEGCKVLTCAEPEADILVNNLGIYAMRDFFDLDDGDWEHILQVNVMSAVRLSRHYAVGMRSRGWGRVQFVSSESALNIPHDMLHYGVSKAAVQGLSRGLAKVMAGTGVTVNVILPGPTRTEGAMALVGGLAKARGLSLEQMEREILRESRPSSLIHRFATPEEVASLSVYAASTQAAAITGATLRVDGGIVESIA